MTEKNADNLATLAYHSDDKRIKRKKKIIGLSVLGVVILFVLFIFLMHIICYNTKVPENLSAQETVEQYFEYWDNGNEMGMSLITDDSFGAYTTKDKDDNWVTVDKKKLTFDESFSLKYLIDNINIMEIKACEDISDKNYYEQAAFAVTYSKSIEEGWQGAQKGQNFTFIMVCKETKDSPWRVESLFTGW